MVTKTLRSRTSSSLLLLGLGAALTGCSGGGSSTDATGTELSFSVAWEQPAPRSASAPGAAAVFDTPIPPSVSAIRFIFRPAAPAAPCCIAVLRGSQAFADRHLVLANVHEGLGTLEVSGYPTDFAPAGEVAATCPTRPAGQGVACSGKDNTLPSFGSDPIEVDVVHGQSNTANVDVHSLPFLLDLSPGDGQTANSNPSAVDFTVVDANHTIEPDVNIHIQQAAVTDDPEILTSEECLDGDSTLPDCSPNGTLEVHGLRIHSQASLVLSSGVADLRIQASNTASPVRSMESNTTFYVDSGTSTTSSPSSSSTSSTSTSSSSTTTLPPETFCLRFSLSTQVNLVGISYDVDYSATGGGISGNGDETVCTSLLTTPASQTLIVFNDNDATSTLTTVIATGTPFAGPVPLAFCEFVQQPPLILDDFSIQVTDATASDLTSPDATVVVEEIPCP